MNRSTTQVQRVALVIAIAATLPYLALKITWISGSTLGIPADSMLLDPDQTTTMRAVNALTLLMDSAVIALALMLTRPWGRRVPAWLLAGPTWLAVGLLGPILVGFPLQVVANLVAPSAPTTDESTFLEPWVFSIVYAGFAVQALALGTLFVIYARCRWSALWAGRLDDLGRSDTLPARRASAVVAGVLALVPLTMQVLWALGSQSGLSESAADRPGQDAFIAHVAFVPFTLAAVAGLALLAFGPGSALGRGGVLGPLALAWTGSGAMTGWGAWSLFTSLGADAVDSRPTATMSLVYAAELGVGLLVLSAVSHFLAERSVARPVTPATERRPAHRT